MLIFTDGNFDATGTTFMLSDWLAHTPLGVVAKNFGMDPNLLTKMPTKDPYMYEATVAPPPLGHADEEAVKTPQGYTSQKYVFELSKQEKTMAPGGGGWVKIQDSVTNFPVSTQLASALVYIEPNGMRELHWHTSDGKCCDLSQWMQRGLIICLHHRMAIYHQWYRTGHRLRGV